MHDTELTGGTLLPVAVARLGASGQVPTHEAVRSDGVVVARGSLERLRDLVEWLNATPIAPENFTFDVRRKQRAKKTP